VRRADADPADVEGLAELLTELARSFAGTGDLARAESHAAQAAALLEASSHEAHIAGDHLGRLATAYHTLGYVQARRDENDAALHSFEQAVTRAKQQLEKRSGDLSDIARLSRIQSDYGGQLSTAARLTDALDTLREAQASTERLLKDDPLNVRYRLNLVGVFNAEGDALRRMGNYDGAVGAFTHAVTVAEALKAAGPDDHGNSAAVLISHRLLGETLVTAGQTAAGEHRLREAIVEGESMTRAQPTDGWSMDELATAKLVLGETLLARGRSSAEGCRQIGDGLRLWNVLAARAEVPAETGKYRDRFERLWAQCQHRRRSPDS
jgi:tetratricopeptide (TPR) repeat protein